MKIMATIRTKRKRIKKRLQTLIRQKQVWFG